MKGLATRAALLPLLWGLHAFAAEPATSPAPATPLALAAGFQGATSAFPKPQCGQADRRQARAALRQWTQSNFQPFYDGILPWKVVLDIWVSEERGLIFKVIIKPRANLEKDPVTAQVLVLNLCAFPSPPSGQGTVFASGEKVVTAEDQSRSFLRLPVLNIVAPTRSFTALLQEDNATKATRLSVMMIESSEVTHGRKETRITDFFYAERP